MPNKNIKISEIFGPTIQGEGLLIGLPTVFVRTGGCDFRCHWCDSLHAVDSKYRFEWRNMNAAEIFQEIEILSNKTPLTISLSGGNPAIQPLGALIDIGKKKNYTFALETQGSIAQDWFAALDVLTLSPKPPSSGMSFDVDSLRQCVNNTGNNTQTIFKFVVLNNEDFEFAYTVSQLFPEISVYLQPCNHTPPPPAQLDAYIDIEGIMATTRWLVEKITEQRWFNVRILPQLHTLIWGNKRGV